MKPRVTVLMAVYNGERFLHEAIDSVLNQTYHDIELLIVDDGSTDKTSEILNLYQDDRVRVIRNTRNLGLVPSLHIGLSNACGDYIARLDADDVALPDRLGIQVACLESSPQVALVASGCELIDESDSHLGWLVRDNDLLTLKWELYFRNPIVHSSIMFCRERAIQVGGYDTRLFLGEDFNLWSNLSEKYLVGYIPQVLTRYRINTLGLTRMQKPMMRQGACHVVRRNINRLIGEDISEQVAISLSGELQDRTTVTEAYSIYWQCAQAFHVQQRVPRNHRPLFESMLLDLLRLARQDEAQRMCALTIASRYAVRYAPLLIMSPLFLNFAAKIVSPPTWRRLFRRAVPRKVNA